MTEIKFRGQDLTNGMWYYGYYIKTKEESKIITDDGFVLINPKTVGQFTGLLDCKGNEIYEGDIIHIKGDTIDKGFGVVMWHKDGYFYIDDSFGKFPRDRCKSIGDFVEDIGREFGVEIYVNGNIHEQQIKVKKS